MTALPAGMPARLIWALVRARVETREELERLVSTGTLMHLPGVGAALFRAAELAVRTPRDACPTCGGTGTVLRAPRRGS